MALTDKLTAIANAIRAKTGDSASLTLAGMPAAIAGIPRAYTAYDGTVYTNHMVFQGAGGNDTFKGISIAPRTAADNMTGLVSVVRIPSSGETSVVPGPTSSGKSIGNCSEGGSIVSYSDLTECNLNGKWNISGDTMRLFSRASCPNLAEITLGGIGFPVTKLDSANISYASTFAADLTVTVYVNAESIADIPAVIKNKQPWGFSGATVIYKSSATGEVLN